MQNFTTYLPSTVIGLIGLLFICLYLYHKHKDKSRVKEIGSVKPSDRLNAIEANLTELGIHIDTSVLDSSQKYDLLVKILSAKTRRYLTGAITTVLLSIIIAIIIAISLPKINETHPDIITVKTLDNAIFGTAEYGGEYIRFYNRDGDVYEFSGKPESFKVYGKVKKQGNNLLVIEGNIKGNFSLNDQCNFISGRVTDVAPTDDFSFDYPRNDTLRIH